MRRKNALGLLVTLTSAALLTGCGSASSSKGGSATDKTIDQMGRTITRYRSPLVEVLVDYKFANLSVGDDWIILNVAITSSEAQAIEVRRGSVIVRKASQRLAPRLRALSMRSALTERTPAMALIDSGGNAAR